MSIRPKLSSIVSSQLPEFIQADYPTFIAFIEAYYEYLENEVNTEYKSLRDLDDTLDSFIQYFKSELAQFLPSIVAVDERFLLENIKNLYEAKGTEASFKLLFRLLFNEEIQLKYPKDYIFRTSNAKWVQDVTFVVNATEGDVYDLVGKVVTIHTNTITIQTSVNRIRPNADSFEVFVDNKDYSNVEVGNIITVDDVVATIIPTLSKVSINVPGNNFYVGQVYTIPAFSGYDAKIKITKVGTNGQILGVNIIDFGSGYDHDFYSSITSISSVVTIPTFPLLGSSTNGFIDYGYISTSPYAVLEYCAPNYSGEILQEFYTDSTIDNNTQVDDENIAILNIKVGSYRKYAGYYAESDGFLSDAYKLQDSYYYQIYSYVISCVESIGIYKDIVKTLIHPTGMKMFGEQVLYNDIPLIASLDILERFVQLAVQDSLISSDIDTKRFNKPVSESLTILESRVSRLNKPISDAISVSETETLRFNKATLEALTLSEVETLDFNKPVSEDLILLETQILGFNKPVSESLSISEVQILGFNKVTLEALTVSEVETLAFNKSTSEALTLSELETLAFSKPVSESLTLLETQILGFSKPVSETLAVSEVETLNINKYFTDSFSLLGYLYWEANYADTTYVTTEAPAVINYSGSTYNITLNN